jgi:hypothetical protein
MMEKIRNSKQESKEHTKNRAVFQPPCELEWKVDFINGKCPFSGCKECADCITNEHDRVCVAWLRDSNIESFGIA